MLVMVMVLLNMLVAILMEAYGVVKEDAKNADSLRLGLFFSKKSGFPMLNATCKDYLATSTFEVHLGSIM